MKREDLLPFVGRYVTILKKGAIVHSTGHVISVEDDCFVFETWPEWSNEGIKENVPFEAITEVMRA
jgi:hypothetical protein